jgi:hypothetical protein
MHRIHKIHDDWVNGNRKDAIRQLADCHAEEVREFMSFLNTEDRGTAMILALSPIGRTTAGQWYDENWNPVTEQEVIEAEYPIECPTNDQADREFAHAKMLLKEGTPGVFQVWVRKVIRAYLYAHNQMER